MQAKADQGETIEIQFDGVTRYVFKLALPVAVEPLSQLLARATRGIDLYRDKQTMRRAC
jgi:hypothetical protein